MNRQEVFDRVATHLLKQNAKSSRYDVTISDDICLYRGPDGLKCAIGALIPDELYNPCFERKRVRSLPDHVLKAIDLVTVEDGIFLTSLQHIHDEKQPVTWSDALRTFAFNNNLTWNIL